MLRLIVRRQALCAAGLRRAARQGHASTPLSFAVRGYASARGTDERVARRIGVLSDLIVAKTNAEALQTAADGDDGNNKNITAPPDRRRYACFARAVRKHRNVTFLALTDGSLLNQTTLQAVVRGALLNEFNHRLAPGVALEVVGRLQASKGKGQDVELVIDEMQVTGDVDASSYPLRLAEGGIASESHEHDEASGTTTATERSADLLRRYAHLRARDSRHAAVLRTRDAADGAIADYFRAHDFVRVAAPILTASDCEGGGEVFQVEAASDVEGDGVADDAGKARSEAILDPSASKGAAATASSASFWSNSKAYLTVSAQLHLEAMALGLGRVYTVGPSFRAEGSATNRHLAEFWMCEGEQLTSQDEMTAMDEVTDVVEGVVKAVIRMTMVDKEEQSTYLWNGNEEKRQRILACLSSPHGNRWPRMTYSEAIEALASSGTSASVPQWGQALSSEQERWLARDGPVFVTHYPATDKPFYMRVSDADERTVACFDLLVPRIGELVGGSLRETRSDVIQKRLSEQLQRSDDVGGDTSAQASSLSSSKLSWYIDDLRRYGCNPHGGFGLGIERLLSWITNTDSVRDVVTFPRAKGPLHF